jgi:hypothetical protein
MKSERILEIILNYKTSTRRLRAADDNKNWTCHLVASINIYPRAVHYILHHHINHIVLTMLYF